MFKSLLFCLVLALPGGAQAAPCGGQNLIDGLPAETKAAIEARVDALPYARGNLWRATRDDETVTILGTYHFDDPRHDAIVERLAPTLHGVSVVLVEAGPEEQEKLQSEMLSNPEKLFVTTGPTLPERLDEPEWQALTKAMQVRGVPGFLAAKMQPWYVSMLLGIPPCAMEGLSDNTRGLDHRVIERAQANDIPILALEPYDTVFSLFDAMSPEMQLDMIRSTLAIGDQAEDYSATLTDLYFSEDTRAIWELGRYISYDMPGKTVAEVDSELAVIEESLMVRRNRAWIPVIEKAAEQGPVFAAFGALHLSGNDGVLALLAREGFSLDRLPF